VWGRRRRVIARRECFYSVDALGFMRLRSGPGAWVDLSNWAFFKPSKVGLKKPMCE
jgi:hypothetical protein